MQKQQQGAELGLLLHRIERLVFDERRERGREFALAPVHERRVVGLNGSLQVAVALPELLRQAFRGADTRAGAIRFQSPSVICLANRTAAETRFDGVSSAARIGWIDCAMKL